MRTAKSLVPENNARKTILTMVNEENPTIRVFITKSFMVETCSRCRGLKA